MKFLMNEDNLNHMANWHDIDPEATLEASKYENPIPSRALILQHLEERGAPATREQLITEFKLTDEDEQEALKRRLRAMERDGQVIYTRRGAYAPVDKLDLIGGRVIGHRDGFGFLAPDDGSDDLFLSPAQMRLVFDGDRALARVSGYDRKGRREGAIVEVVERAHESFVGRYYNESGLGRVVVDNVKIPQEILIPPTKQGKAKHGQFVEVIIEQWPTVFRQAQGAIQDVLGDYMAPGMEIEVALRSYELPYEWPKEVEREVAKIKPEVAEKDKKKRVDLRALPFVTIDGEDARDFDDAVYAETTKQGWKLYVAIADVSHYVQVGSPLDQEAEKRGTSVYFPGQVIPMLPEVLSNGLCSLNPLVDRLVMVCEMHINRKGEMTDYTFYEGIIHSHARLTYNKVSQLLEKPNSKEARFMRQEMPHIVTPLKQLYGLYKVLLAARHNRYAIEFETQETRIVFGADRKIKEIVPTTRNEAHRLIEECMLCANVASALFLMVNDIPGLYRVHDGPTDEKQQKLQAFLSSLGLQLAKGATEATPEDYATLLASIQGRVDYNLIQTVMLRSMGQAHYTPDNNGHFGLNYEAYTHFTSPIRRYPDLLVHRAIRSIIRSKKQATHIQRVGAVSLVKARIYPYDEDQLEKLGEHCSMCERRADEATRDVVNWLKCEYMQERVGETFKGIITAVTGFGLFVELSDIYIEGLVHVTSLPGDYYKFDPTYHVLKGERSGRSFRLGDQIDVIVTRVSMDDKKIDFDLAENALNLTNNDKPKKRIHASGSKQATAKKTRAKKSPASAKEPLLAKADSLLVTSEAKTKRKKRPAKTNKKLKVAAPNGIDVAKKTKKKFKKTAKPNVSNAKKIAKVKKI